jgi:LacI family transcriptional regulator
MPLDDDARQDTPLPSARLTIRDVARAAGVSVGTVSRVLNRNDTVRAEIQKRVHDAIDALGYSPSHVARSMRSRSTLTVGCIIREISIPPLAAFVRAAHDVLHEEGYALLLTNSEGNVERERELLKRLSRRQADGIILGHYTPVDAEFDRFLRTLNVPIVLVDRDQPDWADAVCADHYHSFRRITDHLLSLGHRRIAIITGPEELYPAREWLRGYRSAHEAAGVPVDPELVGTGSFLAKYGFTLMSGLLSRRALPTAVIAGGIDMLGGVLRAIRAKDCEIPRDISVVAASDSDLAELHNPPISVERWDHAEVGRIAVSLLLDRVAGRSGPEPRHILLPTEFVFRKSTAPPRPRDQRRSKRG